jgi:hypothetical protein
MAVSPVIVSGEVAVVRLSPLAIQGSVFAILVGWF